MEIISYVGYDSKKYKNGFNSKANRFTAWVSERTKTSRKLKKEKNPIITGFSATAREKPSVQVAAKPASSPLTFRKILSKTGSFVRCLEENAAKVLISILCVILVSGIAAGAIYASFWFKNYTSPVCFENTQKEIELLDKLLLSYASDTAEGYLSDGTLTDPESQAALAASLDSLFTQPVTFKEYRVKHGDTISGITKKFGLSNISTIIAVNNIENVRLITAGKKLRIPSTDGLIYRVQRGNSLQGLSVKFSVPLEKLLDINELESAELHVGQELFIPGARMGTNDLLQALGELFKNPIHAKFRYTSMFGPRLDPITGAKSSHTGIDLACPTGTAIFASCPGTVAFVGYSNIFGNYVILKHANGYQSLYGHMSKTLAKKGQIVDQNTKIGLVGSTGYSTGPHLHFTVYKNGKLVDPMSVLK